MKTKIKTCVYDLVYIFVNYFVAYIPVWQIRKLLYRLFGLKIGKKSRICMRCILFSPWKIEIGNNVMINEYALLDGRGGLKIGDSTSVSMRSVVYTGSHYSFSDCFEYYHKPVEIGKCCWIGTNAVIMPGSVLGDKAIISVNSVFKGTAKENEIYSGVPAQKVKLRDLDCLYTLQFSQYFR